MIGRGLTVKEDRMIHCFKKIVGVSLLTYAPYFSLSGLWS